MKYPTHIYAKALAEVVTDPKKKNEGEIIRNFLALIGKNGDEAHLPKIIEEASRLAREKSGTRKVTIASARPLKESQKEYLRHFKEKNDLIEERIVPDLIAGIKVTVNDELQFDGTLKAKLDRMFNF